MIEPAPETTLRSGSVVLLGWTNVGKSTLLNRLVGAKLAAVADVAQTTRYPVMGVRNLAERGQIVFIDTPGIHRSRHRMNRGMVDAARKTAASADVIVLIIDASRGIGAGDREVAELARRTEAATVVALNKIDQLRKKSTLLPLMQEIEASWGISEIVPVSALDGDGCDDLLDRIWAVLPQGPPLFDDEFLTDQPLRRLAAEWIRERLLHETRQELTHATAVLVERWEQREDGLTEIEATVLVDRESQKKIVIGSGGELLKRVGTAARLEIERMIEGRVFLRIWVKVRQDWRDDKIVLRDLGLS